MFSKVFSEEKRFKPTRGAALKAKGKTLRVFSALNGCLSLPFQVTFMAKEADGISLLMIETRLSFERGMRWKGGPEMLVYPLDASNLIYCQW